MIIHAAGESAVLRKKFKHAVAVALEAKNENDLTKFLKILLKKDIKHKAIVEVGGPYDGQLMSIGLAPRHKGKLINKLGKSLTDLQTLKELVLDNPTEIVNNV